MNSYIKYVPNVWLAKTQDTYNKGDIILIANKYGKETEHQVYNLVCKTKDGCNCYSVVRLGENYIDKKIKKYERAIVNSETKSQHYYDKSNTHRDFLSLGEPIKVGHHSENRHRKIINQAWDNMSKSVEYADKAIEQENKLAYWENKKEQITLANPDCLEYFEFKLQQKEVLQKEYKTGLRKQEHSFSLNYCTKEIKELKKKIELAKKLWGE